MDVLADPPGLTSDDYPAIYGAANAQSLRGQRRYMAATRLRLALVVFAAGAGAAAAAVRALPGLAWLGAGAFIAAAFVELFLRNSRPDRLWYDGRAAAESAKSLAWRYAVGGDPFPITLGNADERLIGQLLGIVQVVPGTNLVPENDSAEPITDAMRDLRGGPLPARRAAYHAGRVAEQRSWYGRRARKNETSLQRWTLALICIEFVGAVTCLLQAADTIDIDLAGIAAALVGAAVAWLEARQHATVASAYATAHHELGLVEARVGRPATEEEWAQFVGDSEEAISREHTLWRASRRAP